MTITPNTPKRTIPGILLFAVLAVVLILTFQTPKDTTFLSHNLKLWLEGVGINVNELRLRSDIHYLMYFIVGVAVSLYGYVAGWKIWVSAVLGCIFGVVDESLKIVLPTREFSGVDLLKDWIGVIVAVNVVGILTVLRRQQSAYAGV